MKSHARARIEKIIQDFPRISEQKKQLIVSITKGIQPLVLRLRMMEVLGEYETVTTRMIFYRLISIDYPNDRRFYKRLQYSLKRLRKVLPELNEQLQDPTRPVELPPAPRADIELWVEKTSLAYFLRKTAGKYHVPILASRGFGSLSMFVQAVKRAKKRRGVRKVLLVTDLDPSGLKIGEVIAKEMSPVEIERIALTPQQVDEYSLPAIRVKLSDSRARKYIEEYGNRSWEIEALPPDTLLRIVERKIRQNLSKEFLEEVRLSAKAARITEPIRREIEERLRSEAAELMKEGLSREEILEKLGGRYLRKRKNEDKR